MGFLEAAESSHYRDLKPGKFAPPQWKRSEAQQRYGMSQINSRRKARSHASENLFDANITVEKT
jgi:hypothetical protein